MSERRVAACIPTIPIPTNGPSTTPPPPINSSHLARQVLIPPRCLTPPVLLLLLLRQCSRRGGGGAGALIDGDKCSGKARGTRIIYRRRRGVRVLVLRGLVVGWADGGSFRSNNINSRYKNGRMELYDESDIPCRPPQSDMFPRVALVPLNLAKAVRSQLFGSIVIIISFLACANRPRHPFFCLGPALILLHCTSCLCTVPWLGYHLFSDYLPPYYFHPFLSAAHKQNPHSKNLAGADRTNPSFCFLFPAPSIMA